LLSNLNQAENLISSCPACRNNFRAFYCTFTCDPDQSAFLNVTSTQKSSTGKTAVKSLDFYVGERFGTGFFNSCKDVQIGAANSYAMDIIGGGAKNYMQFLQFMGDEKDLGSPFQINYPTTAHPEFTPLNPPSRNCYDGGIESHCTCIDCPDVCKTLPYVPPPNSGPTCTVGALSCISFLLILVYAIMFAGFALGYAIVAIRNRREKTYERMPLSVDTGSPRSQPRGLIGAGSLAEYIDGEQSPHGQSESRRLGRGVSLLDPLETVQPRQYVLNTILRRAFFRLGFFAASSPWLMFFVGFTAVGLLNIGWKAFKVETDPVRLWVAPTSESRLQKEFYDTNFGPFYRIEQIFVSSPPVSLMEPNQTMSDNSSSLVESPVLSWEHLKYWVDVEAHIRSIRSPNGYGLRDVCFKPAGPGGACVVRSPAAWFGNDLDDYDEGTWANRVLQCAHSPVDCLPDFQQPIAPNFVLGGVPLSEDGTNRYLEAEAVVVTYVISDSLVHEEQAKAMEWEESLREYLTDLSQRIPREAGLRITFSTGVSLEEEINKSTNTDIKIVVLSYLAMFLYISLTLGNGSVQPGEERNSSLKSWAFSLMRFFKFSRSADSVPDDSETPIPTFPLSRRHFVGSKFSLGLFGIVIVILSVSSSVGLFSALGVKVTLIIAEVIPFLVLAIGVDNIFILVHELERKNLLHGPNALIVSNLGGASSASPTQSHRSPFDSSHDESVDAASMPLYLSVEDRVARTLSKMGPSILMSSVIQTTAFALGALVPMPAVRNFAIYAAGSVLLNSILQMTVFVSALALDLRRTEVSIQIKYL
jgi:Niemann-Pick C1 protein